MRKKIIIIIGASLSLLLPLSLLHKGAEPTPTFKGQMNIRETEFVSVVPATREQIENSEKQSPERGHTIPLPIKEEIVIAPQEEIDSPEPIETATEEEEEEQEIETATEEEEIETVTTYSEPAIGEYSASYFMQMGVINWGDWRWTWYSEKVLPGGGLDIPGRHVDLNGYVCDEEGYICLASSVLSKGTIVSTPFGKSGKVYDSGCAADTIDVYVSW